MSAPAALTAWFTPRRRFWIWAAVACFCSTSLAGEWANDFYAALFGGGSSESGLQRFYIQKGFHVFLFATMGWLGAYVGVFRSTKAAVAVCSLLALLAEGLQVFFPERSPYLRDAAINLVAAWVALGWHYRLGRPLKRL